MSTRKRFDPRSALPGSPFLTHVALREDRVQPGVHPFTVPWLLPRLDLQLSAPVTFLVGEGKVPEASTKRACPCRTRLSRLSKRVAAITARPRSQRFPPVHLSSEGPPLGLLREPAPGS